MPSVKVEATDTVDKLPVHLFELVAVHAAKLRRQILPRGNSHGTHRTFALLGTRHVPPIGGDTQPKISVQNVLISWMILNVLHLSATLLLAFRDQNALNVKILAGSHWSQISRLDCPREKQASTHPCAVADAPLEVVQYVIRHLVGVVKQRIHLGGSSCAGRRRGHDEGNYGKGKRVHNVPNTNLHQEPGF